MSQDAPAPVQAIDEAMPRDRLRRSLHDLRISVMDRCNFRCPYCMPRERFHEHYQFLRPAERLSFPEIVRVTRAFVDLGVRKVRLTGGEPLLRPSLAELVGELSALDGVEDIALTTNGILLAKYAAELKANGLSRVTVSLDTLDETIFERMSGGFRGPRQVLEGIDAARDAGLAPIKVNAVVQRGVNDQKALDLFEHFRGTGVIVRFIEYMDVGNRNHWNRNGWCRSRELMRPSRPAGRCSPLAGRLPRRSRRSYTFDDGGGEIGFISSVTAPVLRRVQSCSTLFGRRTLHLPVRKPTVTDLRGPLRGGRQRRGTARHRIRGVWQARGRPLQRAARKSRRAPLPQEDRDVLHRWLNATDGTLDAGRPSFGQKRSRALWLTANR